MTDAIGFRLDDDECDGATDDNVGAGCASLTPVEVGVDLGELVRATLKLRKAGAVRVKLGDLEVEFAPAKATK